MHRYLLTRLLHVQLTLSFVHVPPSISLVVSSITEINQPIINEPADFFNTTPATLSTYHFRQCFFRLLTLQTSDPTLSLFTPSIGCFQFNDALFFIQLPTETMSHVHHQNSTRGPLSFHNSQSLKLFQIIFSFPCPLSSTHYS